MTEIIALIIMVVIALFLGRHDVKKNRWLKQELARKRQKAELAKKINKMRDDIRGAGNDDLRQQLRDYWDHAE